MGGVLRNFTQKLNPPEWRRDGDPNVETLGAVEQSRAPAEEARREDRPGCHSGPDGAQQVCVGRRGRERCCVVGVLLVGGGAF